LVGRPRPPQAEPSKKKRGFWARVFGVGKDEKKEDKKPPQ
jgi:hypothetical protein